jgi:Cell division protein CrgA
VPKSRVRKKDAFTPPPQKTAKLKMRSTTWVAPTMLLLFLVGLVWIVVFYVSDGRLPIATISNWNIAIGFTLIAAGFAVSTQWK